jgi:hypothetical protein
MLKRAFSIFIATALISFPVRTCPTWTGHYTLEPSAAARFVRPGGKERHANDKAKADAAGKGTARRAWMEKALETKGCSIMDAKYSDR